MKVFVKIRTSRGVWSLTAIAISVMMTIALVLYGSVFAQRSGADNTSIIRSLKTRIGEDSYEITSSTTSEMLLLHMDPHDAPDAPGINRDILGVFGKGVTEISMAPWGTNGKLAIAIIERKEGDNVSYSCVSFMKRTFDGHLDRGATVESQIYRSKIDYSIMTINGRDRGDGLIVLLGRKRVDHGFEVATEGILLMDGCPQPASSTVVIPWKGTAVFPEQIR